MRLLEVTHKFNPNLLNSGQIRMKCPFRENHKDGSGRMSMYLSPEINAYHCFSCKEKGRLTRLLVDRFEVPFYEAVEMVRIDSYKKEKKENLELEEYYWDLKLPKVFADRGFKKELLVDKFKVGVSGNTTVIPNYWDGELKGLVYRIDEEGKDKKVWSSSNFNKEEYLYNGDARYKNYVVLVEGQSDVWRLLSWKLNAYGTLGTSLSDWQVQHIIKTKKVFIAADCDLPGVKAANNWYKQLYKHTEVVFINYPAKDPDSCSHRHFIRAMNEECNYAEFRLLTAL